MTTCRFIEQDHQPDEEIKRLREQNIARSLQKCPTPGVTRRPSSNGQLNGVSGLCITKLDVMDGLDTVKICVDYRGSAGAFGLYDADALAACEPVYEELPGWQGVSAADSFDALPANAVRYLRRLEELLGVPVDMVSTGAERSRTIVLRHPFG